MGRSGVSMGRGGMRGSTTEYVFFVAFTNSWAWVSAVGWGCEL